MIVYFLTTLSMETIVLDYNSGTIQVIRHSKTIQIEKMEALLTNKYNFRLNEIEWMTVKKVDIRYL